MSLFFRVSRQTVLRFLPILFSLAGNAQTSNTISFSGWAQPRRLCPRTRRHLCPPPPHRADSS